MKRMLKYLIPAILFSVWTIAFGIWFLIEGKSLIGPIFTGIAAAVFWLLLASERIVDKKIEEQFKD